MAYTRINWQNLPSEATALNDVNLNAMDSAIYDHDTRLDTDETAIANKVDKVTGKGLSNVKKLNAITNIPNNGSIIATVSWEDYDNTSYSYNIKNGIEVDSALSGSSTNPVQNKVVKSALDDKVDKVAGKGLSTEDYTTEEKTKLASIDSNTKNVGLSVVNGKINVTWNEQKGENK